MQEYYCLKIDIPESDYLYTDSSTLENAGKGLFTAIEIYKHEIIAIFEGEILSENEIENRVVNNNDQYFINMIDGTILDSMHSYCLAKFANDAEASKVSKNKNNSIITLDDENNVCIIAIKKIKAGQEIFCDYGKKYWLKHFITTNK